MARRMAHSGALDRGERKPDEGAIFGGPLNRRDGEAITIRPAASRRRTEDGVVTQGINKDFRNLAAFLVNDAAPKPCYFAFA